MHLPHYLAWIAVIWHHFYHGTLPAAPTAESGAIAIPPIDETKSTPGHGITIPPLPVKPGPVPAPPPGITGPPAPPASIGVVPGVPLLPGLTIVDAVNGLCSADPAFFGNNQDLIGQTFIVPQTYKNFDPRSQAAYTISMNDGNADTAAHMGGFWVRVLPVVASGGEPPWIAAPNVDNNPAWLPIGAWTIGKHADGQEAQWLTDFRQPTKRQMSGWV